MSDMSIPRLRTAPGLLLLLSALACTSSGESVSQRDSLYGTQDQLWVAAQAAIRDMGGRIVSASQGSGIIVGQLELGRVHRHRRPRIAVGSRGCWPAVDRPAPKNRRRVHDPVQAVLRPEALNTLRLSYGVTGCSWSRIQRCSSSMPPQIRSVSRPPTCRRWRAAVRPAQSRIPDS
jgi:hypothetical protein